MIALRHPKLLGIWLAWTGFVIWVGVDVGFSPVISFCLGVSVTTDFFLALAILLERGRR